MLDLIIKKGQVLDGSGQPAVNADIGVQGDRIVDIGDLSSAESKETFDASGKYVCPGFIDTHTHSDAYLLIEPSASSKVFQGVTTEIVGNCGASAAPLTGAYQMPSDWREQEYPGTWSTVAEYRALLKSTKPAVNVRMLIGHNTIRAGVVGYEGRASTEDEVKKMIRLLEQALEEGGAGLSTGLIYPPGMYAMPEEIIELAKVVARHEGIYTSHMRNEGTLLLQAIDETLNVGRKAGCRVEVSHLKTSGPKSWHLADKALDKIRRAREEGVAVAADRYPYTAGCTDLDVVLPEWASEGGRARVLRRLRDPETRALIRKDLVRSRNAEDWARIMIGSTHHPDNAAFAGRKLDEVAADLNMAPVDALLYLIDTDDLYTGGIFFGMSEKNMWKFLAAPFVMIGSDASLRAPEGPLSHDHPHPRAYGTFPKLLRAALDGKTVPIEEMIRKMTSLPAEHFRVRGRGRIEKGCFADLVVFDPVEVRDTATYAHPHQLARGINLLVVNGVVTLEGETLTEMRGGEFLP